MKNIERLFGRLAEATIRHELCLKKSSTMFYLDLRRVDDGSLEIEDFVAIPDYGGMCIVETSIDSINLASE